MQAETWQQVSTLVARALEKPAAERKLFLDRACPDDPRVRREAEVLLAFDTAALDAADQPVFELFAQRPEPFASGPSQVGPYEIVGELGRGGMSEVFLGRRSDGLPPLEVAVKVLKRGLDVADGTMRLYQEGEILGRLRHVNIASVFGGGITEDGRPFLIMERVQGMPIDDHCRSTRIDLEGRLRLFLEVCDAVDYAHLKLVIHRDLKPSNILVSQDGHSKLLDFGIAKLLEPRSGRSPVTATDMRLMTPEYASPEQVRGDPITVASDIHCLGIVLFQLLTGRLPFSHGATRAAAHSSSELSVESLLYRICFEEAPRSSNSVDSETLLALGPPAGTGLESWQRRLRGDLDAILAMALRKEPEHRYASVPALAADVRRVLELRPVAARSGSTAYRLAKTLRRHRLLVVIVSLALIVMAGLLVDRFGVYQQLEQESRKALATQDFLVKLFEQADPDTGTSGELTVREVLHSGVDRIENLRDQPLLQGHLLITMGHIYANLGLGQEAETLARRAFEVNLEHAGITSRAGADSHRLLGRVLSENGSLDEADDHLRRAMELYEDRFRAPLDMVEVMSTLAFNLQYQSRSDEALAMIQACLDYGRREGLEGSSQMAVAVNNLGFILQGRGDTDGAVAALERAIELQSQVNGDDHPMVALAHSNLGAIAVMNDQPEAALRRFEMALDIWRRTIGEQGRLVYTTRFNIAALLFRTDRFSPAVTALDQLGADIETGLGADHPLLVDNLALLAKAVEADGGPAERVSDLRRRVYTLCLEVYGDDHPKTAEALYQLAIDVQDSQPEQAIKWLLQAVAIEERHLGPTAEETISTRELLAEIQGSRGSQATRPSGTKPSEN